MSENKKLFKFLIPILRRKSLHWVGRTEAKAAARVERGRYKCAYCGNIFGPGEIELDHRVPVINIRTSFTNWDDYINSLFCDSSNFAVTCRPCHSSKTMIENSLRQIHKDKSRNKKKNK